MEVWRIILHKRVQAAADFHYHWKCKEQGILNLYFADDVLIFCKGTVQSVRVIKAVLDEFASDSGLKVNPNKSQVILSHAAQSKIDARLAGWSHLNLSFAGRTQLLRSVMSAMHAYWASVFLLPKAVIKEIEARMRRFLWRGSSDRGYAKVSWDQVCKPNAKEVLESDGVGNGDKFKVWLDIWHERGPLIRHYPRGPLVTGVPLDALLSEVLQQGSWAWPSETDFDVAEIIANLPQIHPGESDSIHWKLNAGCFNTAAVFSFGTCFPNEVPGYIKENGSVSVAHGRVEPGLIWASKRWRGKHLWHAGSRAVLAAIVYHIWDERNSRKFKETATSAEVVARRAIEDVRLRIISEDMSTSLQVYTLYRIWQIPWHRNLF
ncbi:UNVERIFIED_CONTAM: hypothetical protein Sradi_3618000 [Sesamum radiatum]|uniref:Reverse transcriptase domain-containing protein n=1 Tax=Sesamum radiatum TaxID=300843 RepID=A0AAW2QHK1_SESRA